MILVFLSLVLSYAHPFHVSVMEVKYKQDEKSLQISTRMFLDDLEVALRNDTGDEKLDITEKAKWAFVEESVGKYLLDKVAVSNEKKSFELIYLGSEIVNDVLWAYIEVPKVRKIDYIKIRNAILVETYSDQENLIHFRAFDDVQSTRLYSGKEVKVFQWLD